MTHVDMRKLAPAAQEERRRQVIGLRESGLTYGVIAAQTGLSQTGVFNICQRFAATGMAGIASQPRGPEPGTGALLQVEQEAEIRELVCQHTPDELGLPFALWSRAAVRALVEQRAGVRLAVRTMGTYLARWGFTAQKPLRRAYEQSAAAVQHWLRQDYPAIVARARREKGVIYWGDETGLRGDDVRGRSYAPRGHTPEVRPCSKRASVGLISAVTNKGGLRWMILDGALKAPVLIRFLERLIREVERKVFLILDNLPVHRARPPVAPPPAASQTDRQVAMVQDWLAERRTQIEIFYLPAYSPDLNPDEGLHADLKQAVTGKPPARGRPELKRRVINHMRRLSKLPGRVRSFFHRPTARYAA